MRRVGSRPRWPEPTSSCWWQRILSHDLLNLGLESNRLVSSAETCEQCHSRGRPIGPRLRILSSFKDDEANTRSETVLLMQVGGGSLAGIHGAHVGPGVHIRYAASDKKRQTIPWVEYSNTASSVTRTYLAAGATNESIASLATFEMQCVDCHNRAAHAFELPERAVDKAIAAGQIPITLPFAKKTAIEILKTSYASEEEAAQKIPAAFARFIGRNMATFGPSTRMKFSWRDRR